MSDTASTFSQPTTATSGLQPYDLSRRVRNLAPGVGAGTKRARFRRIRRSWTAAMQKGQDTMSTYEAMIGTLKQSVVEIANVDPQLRDELLTKTFSEFQEALAPELEGGIAAGTEEVLSKMADENPEMFEEPLFKGLGAVGRVANLCSVMANSIKRIGEGKDYGSDPDSDPASDDVMALLEHALAACELAMRAAVNEHVDPVEDGEDEEEGMHYIAVPNAEAPDSEDAAIVIKTVLPEELAKFACDPAAISMGAVELGSMLLLDAGVSEEVLGKMFEPAGEPLAKAGGLPPDGGAGDQPADGSDPNADPGDDGSADGGSPLEQLLHEIEILGRLNVAALMQTDHVSQQLQALLGGAGGGAEDDPGADAGADPNADPNADPSGGETDPEAAPTDGAPDPSADPSAAPDDGSTPPKKPKPFGKAADGELDAVREQMAAMEQRLAKAQQPSAEVVELRRAVGTLQGQLTKLSKEPAAPKAMLGAAALSKAADTAGGEDEDPVLVKLAAELDRCRTEDQRNLVLAKAAFKLPQGTDLSPLRKLAKLA